MKLVFENSSTVNLNEGGFSRILKHLNSRNTMFITAFRGEFSTKQNRKRNLALLDDIRNSNLAVIPCKGGFIEDTGDGHKREVYKETYCVINTEYSQRDFIKLAIKWCEKYNQDAVLVTFPTDEEYSMNVSAKYYDKNGKVVGEFNKLSLNDIEEYFTKIYNKTFKLVECYEHDIDIIDEMKENLEFKETLYPTGRRVAEIRFKNKYPVI